jgi:hypothetical protein
MEYTAKTLFLTLSSLIEILEHRKENRKYLLHPLLFLDRYQSECVDDTSLAATINEPLNLCEVVTEFIRDIDEQSGGQYITWRLEDHSLTRDRLNWLLSENELQPLPHALSIINCDPAPLKKAIESVNDKDQVIVFV